MRPVALALATLLASCAMTMTRGPSSATPAQPCTDSYALPIVDGVVAASTLGLGGYFAARAAKGDARTQEVFDGLMFGIPLLAFGITYSVSALIGRSRVARCRSSP